MTMAIFSHNSFSSFGKSSQIPDETYIQRFSLGSNLFTGQFPLWICSLRSLSFLNLSNNSFRGSIPQCLSTVDHLTVLLLRNNSFSGVLPDIFFNATDLKALDVSRNQLEGKLPKSLINCKAIELLNVESNGIKDKFPFWLASLPSLHVLILRSNQFYGPLSTTIGFQNLRVIDVSHNELSGTLPAFYFSNWREMMTLTKIYDNDTYMEYPWNSMLFHRISMEMVLKGVHTKFERIRKDFRAIDFSGNRLCGNIPDSIGFLKGLRLLNLSDNTFTSYIPQSLGNLTKLEVLDLSRNQLSGQIPKDLGNLSFLSTMNFSHNNLQGPVPRSTQFQSQDCSSFMDNPGLFGFEELCEENHVLNPTPQESESLSEPEEQVINWIATAIAYVPGVLCGLVIGHIFASHKHE